MKFPWLATLVTLSVSSGCSFHGSELPVDLGAQSAMSANPAQAAADGISPVQVTVQLLHADNTPGDNLHVRLCSSDPNDILVRDQAVLDANETLTPDANGRITARFVSSHAGSKLILCSVLNGDHVQVAMSTSVVFLQPTSYPTFGGEISQDLLAAGDPFTLVVTALSAPGVVATDYVGTITLSSSDPNALLPQSITFTPADQGVVRIENIVLRQSGQVSISVTDAALSNLNTVVTVQLSPGPMAGFALSLPDGPPQAGVPTSLTVAAVDAYGNLRPDYTGLVNVSAQDPNNSNGVPALPDGTLAVLDANAQGQLTLTDALTLDTVANAVVLLADDGLGHTGELRNISVQPAQAQTLIASADSNSVPQGGVVHVTTTLRDRYGNIASNSNAVLTLTTSDPQTGTLPAYALAPLDAGVHIFSVPLKTVAQQAAIVVSAQGPAALDPVTLDVAVSATGPYFVAQWDDAAAATAGTSRALRLTALAQDGSVWPGYTGTVTFSATDPLATLPSAITLGAADAGTADVAGFVLARAGAQYVIMQDTSHGISGASNAASVVAGPARALGATIAAPSITAGVPFNVLVAAQDVYGNVDPNYTGTMAIAFTDPQGTNPNTYTFTSQDAGTALLSLTPRTAGQQMVTVTDMQLPLPTVVTLVVSAAPPGAFSVQTDSLQIVAGVPLGGMVRVFDSFGNLTSGYTGNLVWRSNNANARLPQNDAFTTADIGNHRFVATLLAATPNTTLTVSDALNPNITGQSSPVQVLSAGATQLFASFDANAPLIAGVAFNVTVQAVDAFGNVDPNIADTVALSVNANDAQWPAHATLNQGSAAVAITLQTTPGATLSAMDVSQPSLTPYALPLPLQAGPATALNITQTASPLQAGGNATFVLVATDAYANTVNDYNSVLTFNSSDPLFAPFAWSLPATSTGTQSIGAAAGVALRTAGMQNIIVTDANGLQASTQLLVTPAPASKLALATGPTPTAGLAANITVTALDAFSNVDPNFSGMLHFSSSDPCATFVGDANFTTGQHGHLPLNNWVTFGRVGQQTLRVTDKNQTQITGLTSNINVAPGAAATFAWAQTPNSIIAGVPFSATLQALDAYGNIATGYAGSVHLSASASLQGVPQLPQDYTFTTGTSAGQDNGIHPYTGIALTLAPTSTLVANDANNPNITGQQDVPVVPSATLGALAFVTQPTTTTACAPFTPAVQVAMRDVYGNTMTQNSNIMTLTTPSPSGLGGNTVVAAQAGVATFSGAWATAANLTTLHAALQNTPAFAADSNSVMVDQQGPPTLTITDVQTASSCVSLQANISGTCNALSDVGLTYDTGNGPQPVALAAISPQGLGRVRSGVPLQFTWDAFANLPHRNATAVLTLSAATAAGQGTSSQTTSVGVHNTPSYVTTSTLRTNGATPVQVVTGADIDGDGIMDSIFADGSSVWIAASLAAGNAVAHAWVSGATPLSLAAEDINQDGQVDLLGCVQNANGRSMVLQLGFGDGTFGATTQVAGLPDCYDTLVTDINNDGKRDILTQNMQGSGMVWALGDGGAHFIANANQSMPLAWAPAPGAMVADVTGDGNVDVLVGQGAPGTMAVFIRNIGTTAPGLLYYSPGGSGFHFAHGDVNRDGSDDAIIMSSAGAFLYMGIGPLTLGTPTLQAITGNSVRLYDVDRDGFLDLLVGVSGAAMIWHGDGHGGFSAQTTLPTAVNTGARAMFIGRLHSATPTSLAVSNGDNSLAVYAIEAARACVWDMQAVHLTPVAQATSFISGLASGDFDEDGKRDVITSRVGQQMLYMLAGDGASAFALAGQPVGDGNGLEYGPPIACDIDLDGHMDIAAPVANQNSLAWLAGDGNGHFAAPVLLEGNSTLGRLATGDFDADGSIDFVATNNTGGITTWYGPDYAQATAQATQSRHPKDLAVGDLNGDGNADAVVISQDTNALSVFINTAGTLLLRHVYTSSASAVGVALADVNQDTVPDVVMADANARTLYVRQGSGSGTFSSSVNYSLPCTPTSLVMADFDGINGPDAAVSCTGSWEGLLVIYNNGSGNLSYTANRNAQVPLSAAPAAQVAADFSSDGSIDVATVSSTGGVMTLARNTGVQGSQASFFGAGTNKLNGVPDDVALEDINRDGWLDVLATNNSQLGVLLGSGGTVLGSEADFGVSAVPAGLATGQVMHDGIPDVVVGSDATSSISYFRNATPKGGTATALSFSSTMNNLPYVPTRVMLADVDNSGTLDALVAGDHLEVLRADAINMQFDTPDVTDLPDLAQGMSIGDLNRDGWVDVVLSVGNSNALVVLLNDGQGGYPSISRQIDVPGGPGGVALADIDADGKLDAVTLLAGAPNATVAVLVGDGNGGLILGPTIALPVPSLGGQAPKDIHLKDVDGDGHPDLVAPLVQGLGIVTLLGSPTAPYFSAPPSFVTAGNGAIDVALGDINHDGRPDYVVVDQVGNQVTIVPGQ